MLRPLYIEPFDFIGKSKTNKIKIESIEDKKVIVKNFYERYHNCKKESNVAIAGFLGELFYNKNKGYEVLEKKGFTSNKGELDLAIKDLQKENSPIEVTFELKKPNDSDMITKDNFYKKSFYQSIYYYLADKQSNDGKSTIKFILISDNNNWFFIKTKDLEDALFDKVDSSQKEISFTINTDNTSEAFEQIKRFLKKAIEKNTSDTDLFTNSVDVYLPFTHFNLADILKQNQNQKLEVFLKCLSDSYLFNKVDMVEKNTLNQRFYKELLYIIGLEETKEKDNKKSKTTLTQINNNFSFLALTQKALKDNFENISKEELEDISLELSLLWINRLLFIQLFSSVLQTYKISKVSILNLMLNQEASIFNSTDELFFDVLNLPKEEREKNTIFKEVPYINSSLFQREEIENKFITINQLRDSKKPELWHEIDNKGNKKHLSVIDTNNNSNILEYFINFINSYDIAVDDNFSDNSNKDLINASVLGKIFEKINGYKDGSFYTPSYVTEYMANSSIEKTILQKFNENGFTSSTINNLRKEIIIEDKQADALVIFNSITICDPAVGSGHFLVSALNALLLYKSKLGLVESLKPNQLEIIDDALVIENTGIYSMDSSGSDSKIQDIYEDIYMAKKDIITNSIFGVDLNSKSVKISRLRLWIELLKHTHFTKDSNYQELELLPNIDINIKQGNSLLSKFALDYEFKDSNYKLEVFSNYKNLVQKYKDSRSKSDKRQIIISLNELKEEYFPYTGEDKFEWRYEFPEILDINGNFIGFDLIIGNPPYFNIQTLGAKSPYVERLKNQYSHIWKDKSDIIFYFIAKSIELSSNKLSFIVSNAFLFASKADKLRNFILSSVNINKIINFEQHMVFEDASITTAIIEFSKKNTHNSEKNKALVFEKKNYKTKYISETINNLENYINVEYKINNVFSLADTKTTMVNQQIDAEHFKLRELFKIGKGMETASDKVFLFKEYPKQFPSKFIKPRITGKNCHKYLISTPQEYILYFEDVEEFSNLPLSIQEHLLLNEEVLKNRATVKNENRTWWKYSRPMHKELYHKDKIFCSRRAFNNTFSLDNKNEYLAFSNMSTIFINENNLHQKALLGLLNSNVLNFRYKTIGKQTGGGSFEYFPNGIGKLPIPEISDTDEKKLIHFVDNIIVSKDIDSKLQAEKEMNEFIYKIYALDNEGINLIEETIND